MSKEVGRRGAWGDLALVVGLGVAVLVLLLVVDLLGLIQGRPDVPGTSFELDLVEALVLLLFILAGFTYYALRRWQELRDEAHRRGRAEAILKEASQLVSSLVTAQRAMGSGESSLDQFLQVAVDHAQRISHAEGASLDMLKGDTLTTQTASGVLAPIVGRRQKANHAAAAQTATKGEPVLLNDAGGHLEGSFGTGGPTVGSLVAVPLSVEGRVMGILQVVHASPTALGESEMNALRPVGEMVAHTFWNSADFKSKESLIQEYNEAKRSSQETEQWLENMATNISEVFWVTSPDRSEVVFVNSAFETVFGRTTDSLYEVPGTWLEAVHPEDRENVRKAAQEGVASGEYDETYRILRGDGKVRWIHERASPIYDDAGAVHMVAAVAQDVTASRNAEAELAAVRRRYEYPYKAGPVVAYAARPSGDYGLNFVSGNVADVLGYDPADMTGDPNFWTLRLHPEEQPKVFAELAKLFEHGTLVQEYRFKHADGEYRVLKDSMRLVRDPEGDPQEIVGFWMDVTEEKRAEEGLEYSLNRIKELQDSRTQLLNTIAHDLGSPLSPIFLQLSILERSAAKFDDRARNSLAIIERNAKQVNMLVQDLKDLARLEAGQLKMRLEPTELGNLVNQAVESFVETFKERGIHLEASAEGPLQVDADPQRLSQVVFNFLTNAMKFTPKGGRVTVRAEREGGKVRLSVTDTGRGLTQEEMGKLFQPFSQIHDPHEIKERGTGLGLFICKGVIEAHGGRIGVSSEGHGKGSTFGFTVPAAGKGK